MTRLFAIAAIIMAMLAIHPMDAAAQDTTRKLAYTVHRDSLDRIHSGKALAAGQGLLSERAFEQYVFPPELVMQHQRRIRLTEDQRNAITREISQVQAAATQLQWRLMDDAQALADQLERAPVNEQETLAQIDRMLNSEAMVKRAQLTMLIRIKNILTAEQRAMLDDLRGKRIR